MKSKLKSLTISKEKPLNLMPTSLEDAERYANIIANSSICPQAFKGRPGDVLAVVMKGHGLGLNPWESMDTFGCINGRAIAYGEGLGNLIRRHPDYVCMNEWLEGDLNLGTLIAYCSVTRKNQEPQTRSFSIEDAKRSALWGKTTYQQYPKRMLAARARTYACRDTFPDALFGLLTEDEAESIPSEKAAPASNSKGMRGLKEALGIVPATEIEDGEIIEQNESKSNQENVSDIPLDQPSDEMLDEITAKLTELYKLFMVQDTTQVDINKVLKRHAVEKVEDLSSEIIDKWIMHLNSKVDK